MLVADINSTYTSIVTSVFSTTIAAKVWFATAAIVLALVQITTAARLWGHLQPIIRLPTATVQRGSLVETAAASGKIEPDVQVEVKSRGSGQVIEVLVKEGDQVQAGQLLVKLDPTDAQRQLASARVTKNRALADLQAARASLSAAQLEQENSQVTEQVAQESAELGLGSSDAARSAGDDSACGSARRSRQPR